jgi:hypothetical protein
MNLRYSSHPACFALAALLAAAFVLVALSGTAQARTRLTVLELLSDTTPAWVEMKHFAKPAGATPPTVGFSGTVIFPQTSMTTEGKGEKGEGAGQNAFPAFAVDFISDGNALIPRNKERRPTSRGSDSAYDTIIAAGEVWHEMGDGQWNRASFPITQVTETGSARNCVATFIYYRTIISNTFVGCPREEADPISDERQSAASRVQVHTVYEPKAFPDAKEVIARHREQLQQPPARLRSTER